MAGLVPAIHVFVAFNARMARAIGVQSTLFLNGYARA
jgi:hypothetical protein